LFSKNVCAAQKHLISQQKRSKIQFTELLYPKTSYWEEQHIVTAILGAEVQSRNQVDCTRASGATWHPFSCSGRYIPGPGGWSLGSCQVFHLCQEPSLDFQGFEQFAETRASPPIERTNIAQSEVVVVLGN
jgi:hypothetical protein